MKPSQAAELLTLAKSKLEAAQVGLRHDSVRIQPAPVAPPPEAGADATGAGASSAPEPPVLEVEWAVVVMSPWLHIQVQVHGLGVNDKPPVKLPAQVTESAWGLVYEYCSFHAVQGRSDKERRLFDDRFSRQATSRLCEVTSAAHALEIMPLVDLGSRAIARLIEGKSPEQIREAFGLPDDLTEEEKLEPIPGKGDRIRLLNRINEKRRRALLSRKALEGAGGASTSAQAAPPPEAAAAAAQAGGKPKDDRPIEELLSFIEEEDKANAAAASKGKSKKKSKKKAAAAAPAPPLEAATSSAATKHSEGTSNASTSTAVAAAPFMPVLPPGALLPLPGGVPQMSLFDRLGSSEDDGSDGDSDLDEALDLDPLRAYLASLALQRRHAPLTTLTSLAAFKASNQIRPGPGQWHEADAKDSNSDGSDSYDASGGSSTASTPRAALRPPSRLRQANGAEPSAAKSNGGPPSAADGDADAMVQLLTAFLQDCGLGDRLQVSSREPDGQPPASSSVAAVTRSIVLRHSGGSAEVRWTPGRQ